MGELEGYRYVTPDEGAGLFLMDIDKNGLHCLPTRQRYWYYSGCGWVPLVALFRPVVLEYLARCISSQLQRKVVRVAYHQELD